MFENKARRTFGRFGSMTKTENTKNSVDYPGADLVGGCGGCPPSPHEMVCDVLNIVRILQYLFTDSFVCPVEKLIYFLKMSPWYPY